MFHLTPDGGVRELLKRLETIVSLISVIHTLWGAVYVFSLLLSAPQLGLLDR